MSPARVSAALAEAVVQAMASGDVLALQPLVAPDVVDHSAQPGQPAGWPGVRERAMTLCAALPESHVRIDVLHSEESTVLARAELTAVRRPTAAEPVPATGRMTIVLVLRFTDALLVEMWSSASDLSLDLVGRQLAAR